MTRWVVVCVAAILLGWVFAEIHVRLLVRRNRRQDLGR